MVWWLAEPLMRGYNAFDLSNLPLNYVYVVANLSLQNAGVYTVGDDCYDCPFKLLRGLHPDEEVSWQMDTSVQQTWRIMKNNQQQYIARKYRRGLICEMRPGLGEFAVYRLHAGLCALEPEVPPTNSYLPLLLCGLVGLSISLIYILTRCILSCKRKAFEIKNGKPLQSKDQKPCQEKMKSLQVFRGLLISLLIFLISGGGGYPLFNNTRGELTSADWIYFMFTWTIGFSIPTTISQGKAGGLNKWKLLLGITKRTIILIFIGSAIGFIAYIPGSSSKPTGLWWPLHRLGVAYFIVASLYLLTVKKFEFQSKKFIAKIISNAITLKWCLVLIGFLFALMAVLISTALSLNCQGNSDLDEHLAEFSDNIPDVTQGCSNNFTEVFNKILFGRSKGVFSINGYYGFSAGLMGILTTVLLTITGLTAGTIYLNEDSHKVRVQLWSFWTIVFAVCGVSLAGVTFPLQLNLWPVATIFGVSSLALCSFIIIYNVAEKKNSSCSMFTATGVASLIILCSHLLITSAIPFQWKKKFTNHLYFLMQNILFVFLWIIIAIILKRKNVTFTL